MNSTDFSYLRSVKKFDPSVIKGANIMTNKTAIDALKIAREALKERRAYCEQWEYRYADEWDNEDGYIQDAIDKLAALEAEKPAEDLKALVYDIAIDCACIQKPKDYDVYERSAINKIQQYAASYHAERCKACRKDRQQLPEAPRV
jgi:hypothetical protein